MAADKNRRRDGGYLGRRLGVFEELEQRRVLSGTAGLIDLGPSDNIALDQPRVAVEFLDPLGGARRISAASGRSSSIRSCSIPAQTAFWPWVRPWLT